MTRDKATPRRGNVQPGGRYGSAPSSAKHMEPEIAPVGVATAPMNVPDAIPGALAENSRRETRTR